ncbi:MAG: 50S ribosomal protein L21 [Pseudomonadota bacterium]|nr:50S ribosomal protein L21 [Pseudomonadota bacterium]
MFAVVRTGGKQYRVAAGDKIVVEKLAGEAGDTVELGDVLLAGEGAELKPTDGLTVSAEIVAQAKGEKVTVFKKRRRHNYRRKKGHRQQHTILRILGIGDQKAAKPKKAAKKADGAPAAAEAPAKIEGAESPMTDTPAEKKGKKETGKAAAKPAAPAKSEPTASDQTDSPKPAKKKATKKPAADKKA